MASSKDAKELEAEAKLPLYDTPNGSNGHAYSPVVEVMEEDEDSGRGTWSGKLDFILSCISFAVGLGNIWRFPFLCYENGGGAFLLPYIFMMSVAGMAVYFLETAMGQFASLGAITVWKMSPFFKGIGYGMVIVGLYVAVFYNVVVSYTIFYIFASFRKEVPWATCGNYWNTENCTVDAHNMNLTNSSDFKPIRPSEEYFNNRVLKISDGMDNMGSLNWELALCLLFAWVIVCLSLAKGIKSSGKVAYATAIFPYVVLIILFIRGITLPGASDGIIYYIKPDIKKLGNAKVWQDAAVQVFFSLGSSFGTLHTLSSFNKWNQNCHRDAIIVCWLDCATSVFGGFVVFSVLGFMAKDAGTTVDQIVASGPGLAFIAYPEAIARMPLSPLWSVLFFAMLFMLGLGSEMAVVEACVMSSIDDLQDYSNFFRKHKGIITIGTCVVMFLIGLAMCTQGGIYLLNLINVYGVGMNILILAFLECVAVAFVYGIDRFMNDLEVMLGFRPSIFWKISWMFISPIFLLFVLVFSFVLYEPLKYGEDYIYPDWAIAIGWLLLVTSLFPAVGYPFYSMWQQEGGLFERLKQSMQPTKDWGPALNQNRKQAGYRVLPMREKIDSSGTRNRLQNGKNYSPIDDTTVV
ncbi:sodium- and chloride-dependent glycine transporter 2-like isoform X2 [Amphiura filiformis]|uniref:sodium- and chloride-dependent glycine transporter 2-like isoform X2 n=1 Tax=Amphiura filiformis TaxID=82378 RepID=UPI003B20D070